MRYPIYFLNKHGNKVACISKDLSIDGTPRYSVNSKCPENTYALKDCLKDWQPVYKLVVGDIVQWKEYKLEVITVKARSELIRCKGVNDGSKTISWKHWLNFSDVKLLNDGKTSLH